MIDAGGTLAVRDFPGTLEIPIEITDDDVVRIAAQNPPWRVERIAGKLVMSPPSGMESSALALRVGAALVAWAERAGGVVAGADGGSRPSVLDLMAPDASWVSPERWDALGAEAQRAFLPFAPDVVVEVISPSDRVASQVKKCERWYALGAGYVVLLDPVAKTMRTWGAPPADDFPDLGVLMRAR